MAIEYVIFIGLNLDDASIDFIEGKDWREAKKLIARCERDNGESDEVCMISKREVDSLEEEILWERKDINYRKLMLQRRFGFKEP